MFISKSALEQAYAALLTAYTRLQGRTAWEDVQILQGYDANILRVTRKVINVGGATTALDGGDDEIEEDDSEAVTRTKNDSRDSLIVYDIIHSPSYRVPVLYITLRSQADGLPCKTVPTLENVYDILGPGWLQPQLQSIGSMGALTVTEHPVTGTVAYFVHPCRTAEAIETVTGQDKVSPEAYLLVWIGLVGQCVGLHIPTDLAEVMGVGLPPPGAQ